MAKLRFDPVIYQFYYKCPPQEGAPAKAAGFGWDPIRRRYYTEDPSIALNLEQVDMVGSGAALFEGHTETFELFPFEADAGAELETTAG